MKNYGRGTIAEFLGDRIVYRNLEPVDPALPGLPALRSQLGLSPGRIPRKSELDYARVIVQILAAAQLQAWPGQALQRLIFIGDTRMNDGTAFSNLCQAGGWPGAAFIGAETTELPQVEVDQLGENITLLASNRWAALDQFEGFCLGQDVAIDEGTAVILDLDKTALGARGRNAGVIDRARLQAVQETVADYLGSDFDQVTFRASYDELNQVEYHAFTGDNQDYLAYISLILGSGLYTLEAVIRAVLTGELRGFDDFIGQVEARQAELPQALRPIHAGIYQNVQAGDPTPFKAFRRKEYEVTIAHMGNLADDATVESLLAGEITITAEVRRLALAWQEKGALLFGLSDKPDEASIPTTEQAAQGALPIHRVATHIVGE